MFQNVLVGADDSATALRAVAAAVDFAKTVNATLHVVTAYRPESVLLAHLSTAAVGFGYSPVEISASDVESAADMANELLGRLRQVAQSAGVTAEFHAVTGEPADAIVHAAEEFGADLIVVGNKGMRGTRRVLGSVPNSVAHHAPCAVLIVDTTADR